MPRRTRTLMPCGAAAMVWSDDETPVDASVCVGPSADVASSALELANARAAALVAAQLTDPAQLADLAALRERAHHELRSAMADVALSVEASCAQLTACLGDLHKAGRNARALNSIAKDVVAMCQEVGLEEVDTISGEPHLRLLQHLSAAQVNTSLVARSVRSLQRDLPRALTALQSRIASLDAGSPGAADELEDLYAELVRLDAQGLMAAATLESSHGHGGAAPEVASTSARAAAVRVAMQHIAEELGLAWRQLRSLMLTHMRHHSRLARTCPQLLVRGAQLAQVHDAAADALRRQSIRPGIMHAAQEGDSAGDVSLANLCADAVRQSYKDHCDAALLTVCTSPTAASSEAGGAMVLGDADAVKHALARADAVLLSRRNFDSVAAKCFPQAWNLTSDVADITTGALVQYLQSLAAAAGAMSNDDLLLVLAWVASVEPAHRDRRASEAAEEEEPVMVVVSTAPAEGAGPYGRAVRPVREEYLRRCGDALRRWVANILAHCAAPPDDTPGAAAAGVSLSSAPVDIFRLIHEQQAVVAASGAAAGLVVPLAFMHLDILDGYAASLATQQRSVVRDAKGELPPGAMEKLLTTCNDAHAAARNTQEHFHSFMCAGGDDASVTTGSPQPRASSASSNTGDGSHQSAWSAESSPCVTPTSVLSAGAHPFGPRRMSSGSSVISAALLADAPADEYRIRDRAAALVSAFDGVSRGCVYRLCEVMFWDVESVLWRCFSPHRWARSVGTSTPASTPSCLRSALATLDDYIADLTMALLPPLLDALLVECTKRGAVTYAALLLLGPPLVSDNCADGTTAAAAAPTTVPDDVEQAAQLCIASDVDALRGCLSRLRAPPDVLEAAAEMLTVTCELATARGSATATRIVECIRQEYGYPSLPAILLNRVASVGVWSPFGASLTFSDTPPGESSGLGSILPAAAAAVLQQMQAPLMSALRKGKAGARRMSQVTWAVAEDDADGDAVPVAASTTSYQVGRTAKKSQLKRSNALIGHVESFKYIDADFQAAEGSGSAHAGAATFKASFFCRVEALCAKRALGTRPRDAEFAADPSEYAMPADLAGPWGRLGALKRRATLWPWSSGGGGGRDGASHDDSGVRAQTTGSDAKALPRRKTLFF